MTNDFVFTDEEMAVDEGRGYPRAYAKLCADRDFGPFNNGPPFTYTPHALVPQEDARAKELDEMFPIIDPKAKPTTKPQIFLSLLWKQLNHLGNAGFDPEVIRVDPYGNVLYYHADAASPLAWNIDHWFPCSRGGLTVLSNLRILQWQVSKRKHNKLEFLIPWWDLQVGISINQFLSIFASSNSDFRRRAFSWLFSDGESEELNTSQTVDSHIFPQHFLESKGKIGLAPAAVVSSRRESFDAPLKSLDFNRRPKSSTPIIGVKKMKRFSNENENALMMTNPYQAIAMARDSLKQREETAKMNAEIQRLDNEVSELQQRTEEEKVSIQELELVLTKKRRRAEKCRKLAESQCSYRTMLEKMIRDAMHQSVVYKEQVRLNQAAAGALMARLEAQKAICDSAERELHKKYKQRDDIERQIKPEWEQQARKRSRLDNNDDNDDAIKEEKDDNVIAVFSPQNNDENGKNKKTVLYLPEIKRPSVATAPLHKELRRFLEEEQIASCSEIEGDNKSEVVVRDNKYVVEERLENLEIEDGGKIYNIQFPFPHESDKEEEDEESRKLRGKGNIEKWMQFLLDNNNNKNTHEDSELNAQISDEKGPTSDELIKKLNLIYPQREIKVSKIQETETVKENTKESVEGEGAKKSVSDREKENKTPVKNPPYRIVQEKLKGKIDNSPDQSERREKTGGKERELRRSESARTFRRIPSSPSLIFEGMKKRVDFMRKKPLVLNNDSNDDDVQAARNSFIKSSIKTIKKAVRI